MIKEQKEPKTVQRQNKAGAKPIENKAINKIAAILMADT